MTPEEFSALKEKILATPFLLRHIPEGLRHVVGESDSLNGILCLCGRNEAFKLVVALRKHMSMDDYAWYLTDAWNAAEYPSGYFGKHTPMIWDGVPTELLCGADYPRFKALPNKLKIYRGISGFIRRRTGYSWTLDKKIAEWFARRYEGGKLYEAVVYKDNIAWVDTSREENEVVVRNPKLLRIRQIPLPPITAGNKTL